MPDKSDGLSRFWKELKRRKVLRSLAIYAGTAFIILEASTIIFPRWNFPDWSIDLVLWLLVLGAVINIFVAWVFDFTPQGIQKTKSMEDVEENEKQSGSKGWKAATYASLLVIVVLIVLNIVSGPKQLRAGDIQSLVILPFENYTGDDQLENMVAGMHSMLIGDMGRLSGLRVIGKTSSSLYKKAEMSAGDIASELNVDAVVEATVMCMGDSICMQFRLVSTTGEEEQLWVGEYREEKGQILNLYNRITKLIAEEVRIELTENEEKILARDRGADRDAIDAYIRSYSYWNDLSREAMDKAEGFLNQAREEDPEWAPIYAGLALVWAGRMQMGIMKPDTCRMLVSKNIERARELDADFADSHFINGIIFIWTDWEWEKGEKELLQALAINPNHAMARMYYAHLLLSLQRMDEAMIQGKLALELDPMNPLILALYSVVLKADNRHQEVLECLEKALAIDPDHSFARVQLKRALYNLGYYERNLEQQEASLAQNMGANKVPDLVSIYRKDGRLPAYQEVARLWEILLEGYSYKPLFMSMHYHRIGEYEKNMDALEKAYEMHNPSMPYAAVGNRFEALHDSVRFLAILDSMHLPHPIKR